MATIDFLPASFNPGKYVAICWEEYGETTLVNHTHAVVDLDRFNILQDISISMLSDFIGFSSYAILFGISLTAGLLSLHYLLKRWRKTTSHLIVTLFTLVIFSFNVALFALRAATLTATIAKIVCPTAAIETDTWPLLPSPFNFNTWENTSTSGFVEILTSAVIPIFLWISDAFLLYRAWVIWVHHRKYIIIPALVYLTFVVCGIVLLVYYTAPWTPVLGISCGLDTLTTGMIAGRLIYHHRKQKKLTDNQSTFYLPVMTIFIESAILSLIAKILQLTITSRGFTNSLIVVPLCTISSNLIVLRKALGADAGQMLANAPQELSPLGFRRRRRHGEPQPSETEDGSIPGGFGSHLVQTIGGHTNQVIDLHTLNPESSEQSSLSNVPKI